MSTYRKFTTTAQHEGRTIKVHVWWRPTPTGIELVNAEDGRGNFVSIDIMQQNRIKSEIREQQGVTI